jgi:hypothetical protein
MSAPETDADLAALAEQVKEKAVVHGRVTLASGREAWVYVSDSSSR